MMKRSLQITLLMLAVGIIYSKTVYSQAARKYSNEFLAIGVGARALGMSNAYVASVNDVTSGYWNPAGLLGVKSNVQIAAMHAEYFAGIAKYDYGSFASPIDSASTFGVSVIRFGVDDIPNTTELIDAEGNINYDRITTFSAADYGFVFSYARREIIPNLRLGANAKVIHRRVGDFARAWGFGLDIGAQYDYKNWKFGGMIRDITTTYNAWSYDLTDKMKEVFAQTGNEIPENSVEVTLPKILLGAAYKHTFKEKFTALGEINFDITTDGQRNTVISSDPFSIDPHLGLEFGYNDLVFLRTGVGNIQEVRNEIDTRDITTFQPNLGLGLKLKNFYIDWAMTDIGDQSVALYSHIFSLKLDLYKKDS